MTIFKRLLPFIIIVELPFSALCQNAEQRMAPVPNDSLEIVKGPIQVVDTPEGRDSTLKKASCPGAEQLLFARRRARLQPQSQLYRNLRRRNTV
jgi:hypothetical protein